WEWAESVTGPRAAVEFASLPASDSLQLRFVFDAAERSLRATIGGYELIHAEAPSGPSWDFLEDAGGLVSGPAEPLDALGITVLNVEADTLESLPAAQPGPKLATALGRVEVQPLDISARRGELLYASHFDDASTWTDWVVEGPAVMTSEDGRLLLRSRKPDATRPEHGHVVLWTPVSLPEAYVVEWAFEPLAADGLAIVFFDARPNLPGVDDLFAPAMPARDGAFRNYVAGAMDSYHISYFASTPFNPSRANANLRKNRGLMMMAIGPAAVRGFEGSRPPTSPSQLRLIRDGNRIQLQCDGRVVIDAVDDDAARFGPALNGGRLGFRQMQWTQGAYDDLTVHALLAEPSNVTESAP
ncbi:MAG: DUF1961 family protein, partial [Planctomycetota bacterium]